MATYINRDSRTTREKGLAVCRGKYPEIEAKSIASQELTAEEVQLLQDCATDYQHSRQTLGWVVLGGMLLLLVLYVGLSLRD